MGNFNHKTMVSTITRHKAQFHGGMFPFVCEIYFFFLIFFFLSSSESFPMAQHKDLFISNDDIGSVGRNPHAIIDIFVVSFIPFGIIVHDRIFFPVRYTREKNK